MKPNDAPATRSPKNPARSRLANGSALIAGIDGRSLAAKRYREVVADLVNDRGGPDAATTGEKLLIRRAATLTILLERLETAFARAEAPDAADVDLYQRCTSSLRRTLQTLGLARTARTLTVNELAHAAVDRARLGAARP